VRPEIIRDARILNENTALNHILDSIKQDLAQQFLTTSEDRLVDLRRQVDAIDDLRGYIKSELINILETVDGKAG